MLRTFVRSALAAGLLALCLLPASASAQERDPGVEQRERWSGALEFRGDRWPVRVALAEDTGGCSALLDLPALVFAREPVAAECSGDGFTIAMPFGLGSFRLERVAADSLRASRALAGDTAVLRLTVDRAPPPNLHRLTVERDGLRLPAVVVTPAGAGPHPAVVLVHGSRPTGRDDWEYRSWADLFARRGVAALYYDRRDLVRETPGGPAPSFEELALDALAAVDTLRARPGIDAGKIGISGGSQAGWVGLLAASLSDGVGFLVLRGAPAVPPAEQEEQSVVHRLRAAGHESDAVQDALAHTRLFFYVVRTGEGWRELEASLRRGREAEWAEVVQQPRGLEDLAWWREHHDFDPLPLARSLPAVPTLLLYGEEDPIVPPARNGPVLRHVISSTSPVRLEIFAHADHGLEVGAGRIGDGRWRFPHRPDRMFEVVDAWLEEHVNGGGAR